jgi:hypothetical protein
VNLRPSLSYDLTEQVRAAILDMHPRESGAGLLDLDLRLLLRTPLLVLPQSIIRRPINQDAAGD